MDPAKEVAAAHIEGRFVVEPAIDELLHLDVRGAFDLQGALGGLLRVVLAKRSVDVDGAGVVPFDEVRVVAVHPAQKLDDDLTGHRMQRCTERRGLPNDLERGPSQRLSVLRREHGLHDGSGSGHSFADLVADHTDAICIGISICCQM